MPVIGGWGMGFSGLDCFSLPRAAGGGETCFSFRRPCCLDRAHQTALSIHIRPISAICEDGSYRVVIADAVQDLERLGTASLSKQNQQSLIVGRRLCQLRISAPQGCDSELVRLRLVDTRYRLPLASTTCRADTVTLRV